MNPITREESLLDGQDLTPITRKEQFIKRIYDKTQEIPEPITREEYFLKKAGESTSPVAIEQLSVTENGTYSEAGKAYSPVIVEVPEPTLITKTITENGTYNASSDNADGYSQVTVNVPYMEKKSASGDIASFSDGAGYPFLKVKANINPVQDLHGYDYPWVGGAGKNKINAPDITLADAGDIYSGAINLAAGTYTLSSSNTTTSVTVEGVSGTMPLTFTLANAITTIQITASGAGEFKNIQIESGSSATSYAPYSNICPISGFTGVNVAVNGKNLFNLADFATTYPSNCSMNDNILSVNSASALYANGIAFDYPLGGQMFIKCKIKPGTAISPRLFIRYTDGSAERSESATGSEWVNITKATSRTNRIKSICLDWATAGTFEIKDLIISTTDSEYTPYNGHVYPISWQDEAGIVYGGYIGLVSGVLTKTYIGIDLSGLTWNYNTSGENPFYYATLPQAYKYVAGIQRNFLCDRYIYASIGSTGNSGGIFITNTNVLRMRDSSLASANDIAGQLVYELNEPQTYNLTPQQINTLIGQNNAWNNTNGQTEVEYFIPIE